MQQEVTARDGSYIVDWELVTEIVRQHYLAYYQVKLSRIVELEKPQNGWSDFLVPPVRNLDVPWEQARQLAASKTAGTLHDYERQIERDALSVKSDLFAKENGTTHYKSLFQEQNRTVSEINAELLSSYDQALSRSVEILKFYRDASAGTLVFASSMMTGGASVAVLAAGSAMTGYGKYQDTGNAGSGVISGVGSFVLGAFELGGRGLKMAANAKGMLLLAKGTVDATSGWVAGDSWDKALEAGATTIAVDGLATKLFGSKGVKSVFKAMPMPVKITAPGLRATGYMTKSLGREFAKDFAKRTTKKVAKEGVKEGIVAATHEHTLQHGALAMEAVQPYHGRVERAIRKVQK